jgi:mono/diheme cytochrome c family protein
MAPAARDPRIDGHGSLEARGEEIFRREQCGRCHTVFDAPAERGPSPPPAARRPAPFDSRVGPDLGVEGHRRSDDWHAAHLYAPDVLVPGSRMPASRHLFLPASALPPRLDEDGRALVAWLQGLGRGRRDIHAEFRSVEPAIPKPLDVPRPARIDRGRALYASWCVPCHGEAGNGAGPAAALLARPPRDLTRGLFRFRSNLPGEPSDDADLFRMLTLGTGIGAAMPSFAFLDPEERWALVLFVKDFAPSTRGDGLEVRPEAAATPGAAPSAAVAEGGRLYAAWGCAACHGDQGEGKALDDRQRILRAPGQEETVVRSSDLRHACARRGGGSAAAFERGLRFGVGATMPSFAEVLEREPGGAQAILAWLESNSAVTSKGPKASGRP